MTKIDNEYTKLQIRTWLEDQIKKAQNPDSREKLRIERQKKAKKVSKNYGF